VDFIPCPARRRDDFFIPQKNTKKRLTAPIPVELGEDPQATQTACIDYASKRSPRTQLMKSVKLLSLATLALAVPAANAAVITDFSSFTESGNLIGNPPVPSSTNTIEQSFTATTTSTTNSINIDYVSGSSAGQEGYFSDAYSLATVGKTLIVDFGAATFHGTSGSSSFGLAIASSEANSTRQNMLLWSYRKQAASGTFPSGGALQYGNFDGTIGTNGSGGFTSGTTTFASISPTVVLPDSLFITKTATGFDLGYIEGGTSYVLYSLTSGATITTTGAAVGVWADSRGADSNYTLNNLRLIPEPSAALLGGLGMLALLRRRR
jgi:hypothetical protein